MIGASSMLDICHYSQVGTVLAIAFGTEDGAHSTWIISPGMEEPMLMESSEGLESSFIDMPICIPSDMDLAEYIATATLAEILKAGYDSSYDSNAHRHSRRRRGTRHAE